MNITLIPRQSERAIVLAAMESGRHIQVGAPQSREGAHALHTVLDSEQSGYRRDRITPLRIGTPREHRIGGEVVRFYRVREGSHEFGRVQAVPVGRIAREPR